MSQGQQRINTFKMTFMTYIDYSRCYGELRNVKLVLLFGFVISCCRAIFWPLLHVSFFPGHDILSCMGLKQSAFNCKLVGHCIWVSYAFIRVVPWPHFQPVQIVMAACDCVILVCCLVPWVVYFQFHAAASPHSVLPCIMTLCYSPAIRTMQLYRHTRDRYRIQIKRTPFFQINIYISSAVHTGSMELQCITMTTGYCPLLRFNKLTTVNKH